MRTIYLDHHATTPLDPRAYKAMLPFFMEEFGNASSTTHDWGNRAAAAVDSARKSVAGMIGASPEEIVFTAGATEANNIAIKGCGRAYRSEGQKGHLITTSIEHKAALLSVKDMAGEGFDFTIIQPDRDGVVRVQDIVDAVREDTVLVSVMAANSEIGTIQPFAEVGAACKERSVLFHTDATQYIGKFPVDVAAMHCDLLSMSAHKFYGPKGVGALYVSEGVHPQPLLSGGGQEGGLRSGTLNVPGIVGMGVAAEVCVNEMNQQTQATQDLRDYLWEQIQQNIPDVRVNGCMKRRLPNNLSVVFERCEGEALMTALNEFALSSGSACQSAKKTPSEVLTSIGRNASQANATVRFGLGKSNTREQVDALVDHLAQAVKSLRALAPETV